MEQYRKLCQKLKEEGEPCGINQPPKEMPPRSGCITAAGLPAIIIDICSNKEDRLYFRNWSTEADCRESGKQVGKLKEIYG